MKLTLTAISAFILGAGTILAVWNIAEPSADDECEMYRTEIREGHAEGVENLYAILLNRCDEKPR